VKKIVICIVYVLLSISVIWAGDAQHKSGWKAGVAEVVITPAQAMWMAGYALRTKPAEGKLHDLKAKALCLKDSAGYEVLLVTSDLLGFPKAVSDRIRDLLQKRMGLSKAQIILNSSHTHSGSLSSS
jgi:hypothetical protein